MIAYIKPLEPFFFRDAKPFDKGEGWANGIFPPLPSTVYGAFRTAAISQKTTLAEYYDKDSMITDEMGSPDDFGSFRIQSVLLNDSAGIMIPTPLDLVENSNSLKPLEKNNDTIISDIPGLDFYKSGNVSFKSPEISWVDRYAIENYLLGASDIDIEDTISPIIEERKTGIEKDPTSKKAKDHMLYVQQMIRLKDSFGFAVETQNISALEPRGVIKLGHDGRVFSYEIDDNSNFAFLDNKKDTIIESIEKTKRFKIIFTSPAILKNGWLPDNVSDSDFTWRYQGTVIKITSIITGRPMRVGGWDIKNKGPKPMYKALPPGSVYYCELIEGKSDSVYNLFFNQNISDVENNENYEKQGFGHTLIGILQ